MVQTRSQTASCGRNWPVVGRLKEVRIPAPPQTALKTSSPLSPIIKIEPVDDEAEPGLPLGNAPKQFSAVSKVFHTARLVLVGRLALHTEIVYWHAAPLEGLQILEALHDIVCDFIENYGSESWVTVRPHLKVKQAAVHYVLRELYVIAEGIAREDPELDEMEHAALRWSLTLLGSGGDIGGREYTEGCSEIHEGMYAFVRWMLA